MDARKNAGNIAGENTGTKTLLNRSVESNVEGSNFRIESPAQGASANSDGCDSVFVSPKAEMNSLHDIQHNEQTKGKLKGKEIQENGNKSQSHNRSESKFFAGKVPEYVTVGRSTSGPSPGQKFLPELKINGSNSNADNAGKNDNMIHITLSPIVRDRTVSESTPSPTKSESVPIYITSPATPPPTNASIGNRRRVSDDGTGMFMKSLQSGNRKKKMVKIQEFPDSDADQEPYAYVQLQEQLHRLKLDWWESVTNLRKSRERQSSGEGKPHSLTDVSEIGRVSADGKHSLNVKSSIDFVLIFKEADNVSPLKSLEKESVSPDQLEKVVADAQHFEEISSDEDAEEIDEKPVDKSEDGRFMKFNVILGHGSFKTVYRGLFRSLFCQT